MTPYQIQQRVLAYVEDSTELPLIRRIINEAIQQICKSNPPNRDYLFLKTIEPIEVGYDEFKDYTGHDGYKCYSLPQDCRVIIDISHKIKNEIISPNSYVKVSGRNILLKTDQTIPAEEKMLITYYRQHPTIYHSSVANNEQMWYDTDWQAKTASQLADPPESSILIPLEEHELIVWVALNLAFENDIEVATQRQLIDARIKEGFARLAANYAIQTYNAGVPDPPTVGWLVDWGALQAGGERYRYIILESVRTVAYELANVLKLSRAERSNLSAAVRQLNYSSQIPQIASKTVPLELWKKGLLWQLILLGLAKGEAQIALTRFQTSAISYRDNFYSEEVAGADDYKMLTYEHLINYLRSIWKTHENEAQLWTVVNEAIQAVMTRVNVNSLRSSWEFTTTAGQTEYTLPKDFKSAYLVYYDDEKIPGRAEHSEHDLEIAPYAELEGQGYEGYVTQSFYIAGNKLVFNQSPTGNNSVVVKYYLKHVYTTDKTLTLPEEPTILIKYCEARIALERKPKADMAKYNILSREFIAAVNEYYSNQENSMPELEVIKSGYPSTSDLINIMET